MWLVARGRVVIARASARGYSNAVLGLGLGLVGRDMWALGLRLGLVGLYIIVRHRDRGIYGV